MNNYNRSEIDKFFYQKFVKIEIVHKHSETCGHPRIIHDDHVDYYVNGRLHFPHEMHCDDHGSLRLINWYLII